MLLILELADWQISSIVWKFSPGIVAEDRRLNDLWITIEVCHVFEAVFYQTVFYVSEIFQAVLEMPIKRFHMERLVVSSCSVVTLFLIVPRVSLSFLLCIRVFKKCRINLCLEVCSLCKTLAA